MNENEILEPQEAIQAKEQPQEAQELSVKEANFISMRRKLRDEEDARLHAERRAFELEQRLNSFQQPLQKPPEDEDIALADDDYVQAKQVKHTQKKFNSKFSDTEKKIAALEEKLAYMEAKSTTDSLKDFEEVVTTENMKLLSKLYPDDYEAISDAKRLSVRSKLAYNMIKLRGIYNEGGAQVNTQDLNDRYEANKKKPQSAAMTSPKAAQTPLTRIDDYGRRIMSDDEAAAIMKNLNIKRQQMGW